MQALKHSIQPEKTRQFGFNKSLFAENTIAIIISLLVIHSFQLQVLYPYENENKHEIIS